MYGIIHHFFRLGSAGRGCQADVGDCTLCEVPYAAARWSAAALLFLLLSASLVAAETPQPLAHWVRLTDGSLLVGRIESIDGEKLRIDLRLEKEATVSVPRQNVSFLVVIPPVDPAEAKKLLASLENEKTETVHLVDGKTLSARLRSFSKGMFRFDLSLGDSGELFLESQPISWRRIRSVQLVSKE